MFRSSEAAAAEALRSCCVEKWQLRENNNLYYLDAPVEQHLTFKLNLQCDCLYKSHRQHRFFTAPSQHDDQVLICDDRKLT